jgi:hypothetical protein
VQPALGFLWTLQDGHPLGPPALKDFNRVLLASRQKESLVLGGLASCPWDLKP